MDKATHKHVVKFIAPYRVEDGRSFRLRQVDPGDTAGLQSEYEDEARAMLQQGVGGRSSTPRTSGPCC